MADPALMLEAERRGILPADKVPLLAEARKRGLVPPAQSTSFATKEDFLKSGVAKEEKQPAGKFLAERTDMMDMLGGAPEAALSMATAIPATMVGNVMGALSGVGSPKFGSPEVARQSGETARKVAENLTYSPRGRGAQALMGKLSGLFDASKLGGLNPSEGVLAATAARPAMTAAASKAAPAAQKVGSMVEKFGQRGSEEGWSPKPAAPAKAPTMQGMGAATTDLGSLRAERAAKLDVPIPLTKGQKSRAHEDIQFERETAKNNEVGAPIRERFSEQVDAVNRNFESWFEQTGAQAPDLYSSGVVVNKALAKKAEQSKGKYDAAYTAAREAGELAEPVAAYPLAKFLAGKESVEVNAPVVAAARKELQRLGDNQGRITLNDLEELRKTVTRLGMSDATNGSFAKEIKQVIDQMVEGKGGPLYQKARSMFIKHKDEFENIGVIDKLLSNKPGTKDRAVAYEDVFKHSVLGGSRDDLQAIRRSLQTFGDEGNQAWKELQGQTIRYIQNEVQKSVSKDIHGRRTISAPQLDKVVRNLDQDGKLDILFGKQGAQKVRDLNETVMDLFTGPPGSINTSNTASAVQNALEQAEGLLSGFPPAKYVMGKLKNRRTEKKLAEHLAIDAPKELGMNPKGLP